MMAIGFVMGALTATFVIFGTLYLFSQRSPANSRIVLPAPSAKRPIRPTYTQQRY